MATTPFPAAREAALKETVQGGKLAILKQWVDTPAFYCCISGTTVGVAKNPVPVLKLLDRVICVGVAFSLDFSGSWSPSDTLEGTAYSINWGDATTTNGNFPIPRDPAVEFENHTYTAAGTYNIVMEVQDSLGATGVAQLQIEAVICPYAPPLPLPFPRYGGIIVGTDGQGVYYTPEIADSPPVWADLQSVELVGIGGKTVRCLCLYQPTIYHRERLYAGNYCGIHEYDCLPPGCSHWEKLLDVATVNAYMIGNLQYITIDSIRMSNDNPGWGYCVLGTQDVEVIGTTGYLILLHTRDYWQSIYRGIVVDIDLGYYRNPQGCISIVPGTDDADVMVVSTSWVSSNVWKVSNYCTIVTAQVADPTRMAMLCWVARDDPDYWYWANNGTFNWSVTGGPPYNTVVGASPCQQGMCGPRNRYNQVDYVTPPYIMQFQHGDVGPSTWGLLWPYVNSGAFDFMPLFRELTGELAIAVRVGNSSGAPPNPEVIVDTAIATTDKTGNLAAVMPVNAAVLSIAKWEDGAGWE